MTNINALQIIWNTLHEARQTDIDNGCLSKIDDHQWDSICEAMAHLHEELSVMHEEID
jgi:hypothetical protein